ncbi:MAG: alpha/beta hydrolase [Bryobacteraceae bacterium]
MTCALAITASAVLAQAPPLVSPEVRTDRSVTFRLRAPKAGEVTLRGDWMQGQTREKLSKDSSGVWTVTLGPLTPDIYAYSFSIDGVNTLDPGNPRVKGGSRGFGSSVLDVTGERTLHQLRDVPHGSVQAVWYKSPTIGTTRRFFVYTPPGYDKDRSTRYPVLYLLHGNGDTESEWPWYGRANFIMDNLLADGKIRPMLVVMPYGHTVPPNELTPETRTRNTQWMEEDVLKNIIPRVDAQFRTAPGPKNRAIAGLSMGGGQSVNIGLNNLGTFAWIAVFSAGVNGGGPARDSKGFEEKAKAALSGGAAANKKISLLWIGCGKDDAAMQSAEQLAGILDKAGIRYTIRKTEGAHTWLVWRRYLAELAALLFR